jgi:hypothetical protein
MPSGYMPSGYMPSGYMLHVIERCGLGPLDGPISRSATGHKLAYFIFMLGRGFPVSGDFSSAYLESGNL